jgi:L-rhamnose mutarotase
MAACSSDEAGTHCSTAESDGLLMTRSVLAVDLKDDPQTIEIYKQHHRRVWPEVLRSLRRAGIREMEIYLLGRRLVMVVETDGHDFRRCFSLHVASHPRVAEWEALMKSMQEPPPGGATGEWWAQMEPVFRLDVAEDTAATTESARR